MEELDPNHLGYVEVYPSPNHDSSQPYLLTWANDSYVNIALQLYNLEMLLLHPASNSTMLTAYSSNLSRLLSQKLVATKDHNPLSRCCQRFSYFMEDNWKRVWVIALWFAICAGLFTWKFIQYRHRAVFHVMGYCVTTAKGAAETLKFNMAIILLPVCRNTITWLRSRTKLGLVVPFNDNLNFHKVHLLHEIDPVTKSLLQHQRLSS